MPHLSALLALLVLGACAASATDPPPSAPLPPPADGPRVQAMEREGFVLGDPAAEGIDAPALARLIAKAKAQRSEALVVVKNGKLVYEDYFGLKDEPIYAMSASKSFTALAIAFLLAEGKLASLDEPVARILPGFAASDPRKAKLTYRHLLAETSGLDPRRAGAMGDIEAHGIAVSCVFEPGTSWQYSNNGVDLLAALAGKLAGKPMDQYLNERLFRPMGIAAVDWTRDKKGVPLGAGEMLIRPLDMAKIGQLMLDGGLWRSTQLVPSTWIAASFAQSSTFEPLHGLLWWRQGPVTAVGVTDELIGQWRTAGLAEETAAKLGALVGQKYADYPHYNAAVRGVLDPSEGKALDAIIKAGDHLAAGRNLAIGTVTAYDAAGWLGQFLVVAPDKKLVAVRMRRPRDSDYGGGPEVDGFPTFPAEAPAIAP